MDATQADEEYKEPSMQPGQTKHKVEREDETAKKRKETVTKPPHKRHHRRKKKNAKMRRPSRARAAGRKAQKRKVQPKVKKKLHRGQMKKHSLHCMRANVRGKRGKKVRPARRK